MTIRQPISVLVSSLARSSTRSQHVCFPCQQQLNLQQRQNQQTRSLHRHVKAASIPPPTPFVPDVSTFLTLIGRKLSTHASKFEKWDDLFTLSSPALKDLGVEPTRSRRYLLRWREKFRKGEYGIGGDLQYVQDGTAELRVVEVPSLKPEETFVSTGQTPGMQKLVVNVPAGSTSYVLQPGQTTKDLKKPAFVQLRNGHAIAGSHILPVKGGNGSVATLKVQEGLWEHKRGRKIFGGERRRAETLHKMRVAERKKNER